MTSPTPEMGEIGDGRCTSFGQNVDPDGSVKEKGVDDEGGSQKVMSMEEKLALWRTQKRANKVKKNRKIVQGHPPKAPWPPAKCDTFTPPRATDTAKQASTFFSKNMKISFEPKPKVLASKSRRHSLGPGAHRNRKGAEKGGGGRVIHKSSACQTAGSKGVTTYTQTSLLCDDKQVQTEETEMGNIGNNKLQEEVDSLRFANEVLLQQVREGKQELDARKADEQVLTLRLQRKDDKLEEQERKFAEELMQIQNILKAGLEKSVVEIDSLRKELDKYKELYYNLLESTQPDEIEASDTGATTPESCDKKNHKTTCSTPSANSPADTKLQDAGVDEEADSAQVDILNEAVESATGSTALGEASNAENIDIVNVMKATPAEIQKGSSEEAERVLEIEQIRIDV